MIKSSMMETMVYHGIYNHSYTHKYFKTRGEKIDVERRLGGGGTDGKAQVTTKRSTEFPEFTVSSHVKFMFCHQRFLLSLIACD